MGANLSKQPKTEVVKMTAVIAALCFYLQKTVNEPHNPPRAKAGLRHQQGATSSTSSGGLSKTPSVVNLMRSERLSRAEELERSVPRSYKMALKSFAHCYAAIGVLDVLFARNSKARFFALHALVNAIVTTMAIPDLIKTAFDPVKSMQGRCNVIPAYMILTLFIYHVTCFKNVGYDEWWHHILFGVGIGGVGLHYCPGPLQNALSFFISGFPGGVDYAMLMAVKDGQLRSIQEKVVNSMMNAWVRGPGLTIVGYSIFIASKYGKTAMPMSAAAICAFLSFFNGNYYATRVVASAGAARWRPS
eukprot:INCI15695.1.p1 GENE.INCI15695.1~~INCI15695.1.p1  ORF type:complete len:303 (+),score=36.52 INCI15695.1:187-1095(+)